MYNTNIFACDILYLNCNIINAYWILVSWNSSTVMIHTDVLLPCKMFEFTRE